MLYKIKKYILVKYNFLDLVLMCFFVYVTLRCVSETVPQL